MSSLPAKATISAEKYTIDVPQQKLDELHQLLKLSKLPPATYEGQHRKFGVTDAWMKEAKDRWETGYDWRASEAKLNKFPQFLASVQNKDGNSYDMHFVGIFSSKPNAVPLVLLHGWPGSWIEFQHIIPLLEKSTSPAFHIIVPSLPGYGASQQPPLDKDFNVHDIAFLVNQLMVGLGFGGDNGGYIAQGGDIGSFVSFILGQYYPDNCKAIHQNMCVSVLGGPPEGAPEEYDELEREGLKRMEWFRNNGRAYALEHATRPSTIGHVMASSPLALLAWVGEKFLDWTDKDPTVDQILEFITLWWLTETFPRSIYPYRHLFDPKPEEIIPEPVRTAKETPTGFSYFPKELVPAPKRWVELTTKLVHFSRHDSGGHFAAFEEPELLASDITGFVNTVW